MSEYTIKRAKYSEYKTQVDELIKNHWQEVGMPGVDNLALDIDNALYETMEAANNHLGMLILDKDKIIGYLSVFIYNHHQHKNTKFAQTDGFFLDPAYRGVKSFRTICNLFNAVETILINEYKVEYFCLGTSAENDLKFFANCMKFVPSSVVYVKRLN